MFQIAALQTYIDLHVASPKKMHRKLEYNEINIKSCGFGQTHAAGERGAVNLALFVDLSRDF